MLRAWEARVVKTRPAQAIGEVQLRYLTVIASDVKLLYYYFSLILLLVWIHEFCIQMFRVYLFELDPFGVDLIGENYVSSFEFCGRHSVHFELRAFYYVYLFLGISIRFFLSLVIHWFHIEASVLVVGWYIELLDESLGVAWQSQFNHVIVFLVAPHVVDWWVIYIGLPRATHVMDV